MLKTQITGAKYLSPQTNQMTNLNIAVPADSKDTKFGTSDIMLAKDVVAHYYTKEETDNQIQIAKNSAINMHNEDNTKSIKLDINDTEADSYYSSPVNISLIDDYQDCSANINAFDGFKHSSDDGRYSNLYYAGLHISDEPHSAYIYSDQIDMYNSDINGSIEIKTNKELTEEEQNNGYSPVNMSLTYGDYEADINAQNGFTHRTDDGFISGLGGYGLYIGTTQNPYRLSISTDGISLYNKDENYAFQLSGSNIDSELNLGADKFKIFCPINDTEGATIKGVQSITAFTNPSATKVWATDGSTVDLTTKANASDVLLKKSASGGYYIEENSNELGSNAFAANYQCTAGGSSSFAEGRNTKALSAYAHAEGYGTVANAISTHAEGESTQAAQPYAHAEGYHTLAKNAGSHAEGCYTVSNGYYSHAEGFHTLASGSYAHAQGTYNVDDKNAIHSVGIGNGTTRKNAEYIYTKNNENGHGLTDDPKNGYKYLIGVGGYDGISTDNTTYKSVQEVIADLTLRIEQLETKVRALEAANTPA